MNARRITAQIACEYIINHPDEGFFQRDRRDVLAASIEANVAEAYLDGVVERIQLAAMAADA